MAINVLDCTLRDGAYVVNSVFGKENIKNIISSLNYSGIEIVECGWLRDCEPNINSVFYNTVEEVFEYLPKKKAQFALMFDYGKYDLKKLPQNQGIIDIIRIAFYKKSLDEISFAVEAVKSKGYKVFLQPSNIMEYEEKEIIKLCNRANFLGVDAAYIVDSFGSMFPENLEKILPYFNEIINHEIKIGFHSHNSIQLSLGLTIQFINSIKDREICVDASLCGIGRGAGNTKTELLLEYLNRFKEKSYDMNYIRSCIDNDILNLYKEYNWEYRPYKGYKGILGLHPNTDNSEIFL